MREGDERGGREDAQGDRLSRFAALILRHKPETVGINLDSAGFVDVTALAQAMAAHPGWAWVDEARIRALAARDPRRYELDGTRIRARYGHSVAIETPGKPVVPPEWLYHGTTPEALDPIRSEGLRPRERQFVHLSTTRQDAMAVGNRHAADTVVVTVLARRAHEAGHAFYLAAPSIYLVKEIQPDYLQLPTTEPQPLDRAPRTGEPKVSS